MDKLPVELLLSIMLMLQPGDLKCFRLVKRLWREVCFSVFMKHLVVDDVPERLHEFQAFLRSAGVTWTEHITVFPSSLCDGGIANTEARLDRLLFLRQLPRLQQLTIRPRTPITTVMAQHSLNVVRSIFVAREVSIYGLLDMGRVREVVCPFVSVLRINSNLAPSARQLTIFIGCFPALRHLSLIFQEGSAMLIFRAMHWPRLAILELTGFRIQRQHLVGFLQRHPDLENVTLRDVVFAGD